MQNFYANRGAKLALLSIGLDKIAAEPEFGAAMHENIMSSTGDAGRLGIRTTEDPAAQVSTGFGEHDRHVLRDPHNDAHTIPVGGGQSKAASLLGRVGSGIGALSLAGIAYGTGKAALGDATGSTPFYHGTSKPFAEKIEAEGLKASQGGKASGSGGALGGEAGRQFQRRSKRQVHVGVGPLGRNTARAHANLVAGADGPEGLKGFKYLGGLMGVPTGGKIVSGWMPTGEFQERFETDPDLPHAGKRSTQDVPPQQFKRTLRDVWNDRHLNERYRSKSKAAGKGAAALIIAALAARSAGKVVAKTKVASRLRKAVNIEKSRGLGGDTVYDMMLGDEWAGGLRVSPTNRVVLSNIAEKFRNLGLGKKLYGEVIRRQPKQTLKSDRTISTDAQRVWRSMQRDPKYSVLESPTRDLFGNMHPKYPWPFQTATPFKAQLPPEAAIKTGKAHKLHGRRQFRNLEISIENRRGSKRHWHDPHSGESGSTTMKYPYGYIRMTKGMDGDHVDCFVGPNEDATFVYVITTNKKPEFTQADEQKCMLGFNSAKDAKAAFHANYNDKRFFREMTVLPYVQFEKKVLATLHGGVKKVATNMNESDRYSTNTGTTHNQVPGDHLGLPQSSLVGMRSIKGDDMGPDDKIDRMFRFHDEDTSTRVLDGNSASYPESPGV